MESFAQGLVVAWGLLLSGDATLWQIVARSLTVGAAACALACGLGLPIGAWLAVARFPGRAAVVTVVNTLLAVPSVVIGLVVYLLLSRSGPLGFLGWLFAFQAMVLAQTVLVLPLVTGLTRQVVEDVESQHGEQLRELGAGTVWRGWLLAWNERYALLTIAITAFARAVSEVGAVMVVGGNIEGFTRVMTTAITLDNSKGDLSLALVGSNGSGKSTLLRALMALLPVEGELRRAPGMRAALVFQRPYLMRLSALHNVAIALWLQGQRWVPGRHWTWPAGGMPMWCSCTTKRQKNGWWPRAGACSGTR